MDALDLETLSAAPYRPLRYGSSGEDVKKLQTRLTNLGYYKGKISGNYLDATVEAVSAFQTKMGELVTGEADIGTQTLLYGESARTAKQSALKSTATATPVPEVIEVPDGEEGAEELTPSPTTAYSKTLKKGSTGDLVKQVQQRLKDLMYYTGPVSGNYQAKTVSAVKRFQEQNGLKADGTIGEDTWNALFNAESVVPPDATAKPTAEPTPEPDPAFHIVVDVNNQVVIVYGRDENGDYTQVVREMICSTGTKRNPSPVGDWTLNGRKANWCYFPAWGDYARYWTRINASVAFHSVIYMKVNTMSLSVKSYKNLGSRASHGCVRLLVSDAKWIYDNVEAGTVVTITDSLPSDPELKASVKQPELNYSNMLPYETPKPTEEPTYVSGAQPPMPLQEMKKNSSGEDVWWLQKKLTELGYYSGKCSGTYLDGTANAVKEFQKDHDLKQTGTADLTTLELIYQDELSTPAPAATATEPAALPTPAPTGDAA